MHSRAAEQLVPGKNSLSNTAASVAQFSLFGERPLKRTPATVTCSTRKRPNRIELPKMFLRIHDGRIGQIVQSDQIHLPRFEELIEASAGPRFLDLVVEKK